MTPLEAAIRRVRTMLLQAENAVSEETDYGSFDDGQVEGEINAYNRVLDMLQTLAGRPTP